jgi:hypothetical protein
VPVFRSRAQRALAARGYKAVFSFDIVSFQTHQHLIPFLEALDFCGRSLHHDSTFLGLELQKPPLTIDPLNGRRNGVSC